MTSFAVVTPSRGLVHSRTVEAVTTAVAQAAGYDYRGWFLSHALPIPECHNTVAEAAYGSGAEAIWFVEEDVVPPSGALLALLALAERFPIAAIDYPVGESGWSCIRRDRGGVSWCGLGCTLISREVFAALPRPWFSDEWVYLFRGRDLVPQRDTVPRAHRYGHQDIRFCLEAGRAGFGIGVVDGMTAAHAHLVELGPVQSNEGCHRISVDERIPVPQP